MHTPSLATQDTEVNGLPIRTFNQRTFVIYGEERQMMFRPL